MKKIVLNFKIVKISNFQSKKNFLNWDFPIEIFKLRFSILRFSNWDFQIEIFKLGFSNWDFQIEILKLRFSNWDSKIEIFKLRFSIFEIFNFEIFKLRSKNLWNSPFFELWNRFGTFVSLDENADKGRINY